jgi:hypothetical protein
MMERQIVSTVRVVLPPSRRSVVSTDVQLRLHAIPSLPLTLLTLWIVGMQDAALPQFSSAQFHLDILSGKDESLDVEHFFNGSPSHPSCPSPFRAIPSLANWEGLMQRETRRADMYVYLPF